MHAKDAIVKVAIFDSFYAMCAILKALYIFKLSYNILKIRLQKTKLKFPCFPILQYLIIPYAHNTALSLQDNLQPLSIHVHLEK